MIKVVIFDVGGVLVEYGTTFDTKRFAEMSGKSEKEAHIIEEKYLRGFELGKTRIAAFESGIAKELGINKNKIIWTHFFETHAKLNQDTYDLLKELHNYFSVAILSNIDKSRYAVLRKILPFTYIDHTFTSCYIGLRKPDTRIYKYVLKKLAVKPDEAVFIDNKIENVNGARAVGMNGILFEGRRKLDIELSKFIDL